MPSLRLLLSLSSSLVLSGCYFSSPPTTPLGHSNTHESEKITDLSVKPEQPRLSSQRIVLLGRFESQVTQPIGGLYDYDDYDTSPLYRTYFFKHGELELFEHTTDCLRASGLDFRKDYATTGSPALIEAPLRQLNPLVVRTKVLLLQHDQVRTDDDPPRDFELAHLVADVTVLDLSGRERYAARQDILGRLAHQDDANMLRILGLTLGQRLLADPRFLAAIEASRGAS